MDGGRESWLDCGEVLGLDDRLWTLDEVADSLDRSSEDGDWLDGLFDADDRNDADGDFDEGALLAAELPLWLDAKDELGVEDLDRELLERREL